MLCFGMARRWSRVMRRQLRVAIALLAVLLTVVLELIPALDRYVPGSDWLRDVFIRLNASEQPETRIAVIDIDEASLAEVGAWPWPRQKMAALVESLLDDYGAAGVALDMVFPDAGNVEDDAALAQVLMRDQVVLAQVFDYVKRTEPLRVGMIGGGDAEARSSDIVATGFIGNHAAFARSAHWGNIGLIPDEDGVIRRLPLNTQYVGQRYRALTTELLTASRYGDWQLAWDERGAVRVPYRRSLSAYTVISASDLLALRAPLSAVSGRLVLVGSSSLGLADAVASPLSGNTSGVLIHASLLSALLDEQQGGQTGRDGRRWAIIFVLLVAGGAAYVFPRRTAAANMALLVVAVGVWLMLAGWLVRHDQDFSLLAPLVSLFFVLSVAVPFEWQLSQRESRELLDTLRHYVAPSVVAELLRGDVKSALVPRFGEVTTLIVDMEGYTQQVENLPSAEAAELTRVFLDCLTRPVFHYGGTLDRYTGDGLVAFWGAPLQTEDHADLALDAALMMHREVQQLSEMRDKAGLPGLRIRVGIESGTAMFGDFGSSYRSIYTAVGDCVNTASRLENLARELSSDIIVGQGTAKILRRHHLRPLGEMKLRGKVNPVAVFSAF